MAVPPVPYNVIPGLKTFVLRTEGKEEAVHYRRVRGGYVGITRMLDYESYWVGVMRGYPAQDEFTDSNAIGYRQIDADDGLLVAVSVFHDYLQKYRGGVPRLPAEVPGRYITITRRSTGTAYYHRITAPNK